MRSGNPALTDSTFLERGDGVMTVNGTINKTGFLVLLCTASAGWTWTRGGTELVIPAAIAAFVVALITIFAKRAAPFTAPLYALLEGVVLGAISMRYEAAYPGIVVNAVGLTLLTLFALLLGYRTGAIKVTDNFRSGLFAATAAIALLYLVELGLMVFTRVRIPLIHESGTVGILFSLFVVGVAAFNLVLDFDFIEKGAEHGAPKHMEWYGGFGLLVTLVWLYLELLRLLAKTQSRRR